MGIEVLVLFATLLLLAIGLIIKVLYQDRDIHIYRAKMNALSIELATLQQKEMDQRQILAQKSIEVDALQDDNRFLNEQLNKDKVLIASLQTKMSEQNIAMHDRLEDLKSSRELLKEEFSDLANRVLLHSQKSITEQNKDSLNLILHPIKEQLGSFKQKVEEVYIHEAKERTLLQRELKTLQSLNVQMSQDATDLTNALKGENKTQGSWGEMVLERILESSGLRVGHEYKREVTLKSRDGKSYRPDVLVKLPHARDVIIDAKTSLKDYEAYMTTQDEKYLKAHIISIKKHIHSLAQKEYESLEEINSLDFILMFIPISGALMLALQKESRLYEEAFGQKVVLVSPETLLLSLKAIENSWRYQKQAKNAVEVTRLAQKFYTKLKTFVDDLEQVGSSLQKAQKSYDSAYSKLYSGKDNMIRQVEVFRSKANIQPKESLSSSLVERAMLEV